MSLLFFKHTHMRTCGHIYTHVHTHTQAKCRGPKEPMIMGDGVRSRVVEGGMDRWPCSAQFSSAPPSRGQDAP